MMLYVQLLRSTFVNMDKITFPLNLLIEALFLYTIIIKCHRKFFLRYSNWFLLGSTCFSYVSIFYSVVSLVFGSSQGMAYFYQQVPAEVVNIHLTDLQK